MIKITYNPKGADFANTLYGRVISESSKHLVFKHYGQEIVIRKSNITEMEEVK